MNISQDERERAVFRSRKMYRTDEQSNLATARDNGAKQATLDIARRMLKRNRPLEEIMEDTGLSQSEIEGLLTTS